MKPLPNWDIWKHVPILTATEAVALTLNIQPHSVYEWSKGKWVYNIGKKSGMCSSIESFADRLFLFRKCFGVFGKISLVQLANWSQSVGWNIPIELAKLAPIEPKEAPRTLPTETILKALADIVALEVNIDDLHSELIKLNVKFIVDNEIPTVQIPDGTVKGKRELLSNLYSVVSELCNEQGGDKLSTLVRGSGASGGGAPPGGGNGGGRAYNLAAIESRNLFEQQISAQEDNNQKVISFMKKVSSETPQGVDIISKTVQEEILNCVKKLGHDPLKLPNYKNGFSGVKAQTCNELKKFDKLTIHREWQKLLNKKMLKYLPE